MKNSVNFFKWWFAIFAIATVVALIVSIIVIVKTNSSVLWLLLLILLAPLYFYIHWANRLVVLPEWTLVYEWCGKKMEPLKNGYYYPIRFFGLFREVIEVPMNDQTFYILSGERKGLEKEIVDQYVYGTASNMEPKNGDFLRLLYRVEFKCIDPLAAVYNVNNPYDYAVGLIESKVNLYVHGHDDEYIVENFAKENLNSIFSIENLNSTLPAVIDEDKVEELNLIEKIKNDVGLEILSFIPVDVINTPEVVEQRRKIGEEERQVEFIQAQLRNSVVLEKGQKKIIKAQLENELQREKGQEVILTAKLKNVAVEDKIRVNTINSIKATGLDGKEAVAVVLKEKTLETIEASATKGNIVYVDESSKGNLEQATAMGFAISATNQKKS